MPSNPFPLKPVSPRAVVAKLRPREAGAAPYATGPLQPPPRSPIASTVLATIGVVGMLWWGQRFFVPVAAGLMLAMLVGGHWGMLQVVAWMRMLVDRSR
mgnify:CR=1 FL=1